MKEVLEESLAVPHLIPSSLSMQVLGLCLLMDPISNFL